MSQFVNRLLSFVAGLISGAMGVYYFFVKIHIPNLEKTIESLKKSNAKLYENRNVVIPPPQPELLPPLIVEEHYDMNYNLKNLCDLVLSNFLPRPNLETNVVINTLHEKMITEITKQTPNGKKFSTNFIGLKSAEYLQLQKSFIGEIKNSLVLPTQLNVKCSIDNGELKVSGITYEGENKMVTNIETDLVTKIVKLIFSQHNIFYIQQAFNDYYSKQIVFSNDYSKLIDEKSPNDLINIFSIYEIVKKNLPNEITDVGKILEFYKSLKKYNLSEDRICQILNSYDENEKVNRQQQSPLPPILLECNKKHYDGATDEMLFDDPANERYLSSLIEQIINYVRSNVFSSNKSLKNGFFMNLKKQLDVYVGDRVDKIKTQEISTISYENWKKISENHVASLKTAFKDECIENDLKDFVVYLSEHDHSSMNYLTGDKLDETVSLTSTNNNPVVTLCTNLIKKVTTRLLNHLNDSKKLNFNDQVESSLSLYKDVYEYSWERLYLIKLKDIGNQLKEIHKNEIDELNFQLTLCNKEKDLLNSKLNINADSAQNQINYLLATITSYLNQSTNDSVKNLCQKIISDLNKLQNVDNFDNRISLVNDLLEIYLPNHLQFATEVTDINKTYIKDISFKDFLIYFIGIVKHLKSLNFI